MSPINVLVIFQSRSGRTEKLALAAAVGAVQARASIRLRLLPDASEERAEALDRMRKEYVPPTAADVLWADAVIVGLNGRICGVAVDPADATSYGRRIAAETRDLKSASPYTTDSPTHR